MTKNVENSKGFTLIETAIVLIIGGLIMTMLFNSLDVYLKNTKINTTRERLAQIDNQLQVFLEDNGRLPCPAALTTKPNETISGYYFGQEVLCTANVTGVTPTGTIRIGMVPIRTLNLPDDFAFDGWGNRIVYAMTTALGATNTYDRNGGTINIVDINNNNILTPANSAHYVALSPGENKVGGYNANGSVGIACPTSSTMYERQNCDFNNVTFRRSVLLTDTTSNPFDDLMIDRSATDFSRSFPAEAIVLFHLTVCPTGWSTSTTLTKPDNNHIYCIKQ